MVLTPDVERGGVTIRTLCTASGMQEQDMSICSDVQLVDGIDSIAHTEFFPPPRDDAVAQALEKSDWYAVHVGDGMTAAAVLAPGKHPFTVGKPVKMADVNHFHFSTDHLGENLLRATARQHGKFLTGVLQPCAGCVEAKGVRAGVLQRTTSHAARPMETMHIDLAGPYDASMGGSVYLIMFVDSALRWMRPFGIENKSETTAHVNKFIADMNHMGLPRCFCMDNGEEFTSRSYVDFCDFAGILREHTAPGRPQQNAVVESAIWRAMKGGHAARGKIQRRFPDVDLRRTLNLGASGNRL